MLPPPMTITTTITNTTTTTTEYKCTACGATCYKIVHQVSTYYFPDPSYAGNTLRPPQDIPNDSSTRRVIAPDPSPPVGLPDYYYQIMQQLKEFEPLSDEVFALRQQLEEYMAIAKSNKDNAGRNWLYIPLPENIRNILVRARDVLNSLVHISTPPKARDQ